MEVRGRRVTVFGMKDSGLAAAALLRRHGADVRASDIRPRHELPDFDFPFVPQSAAALEGCDIAVLSPGVPADLPIFEEAAARGVLVVGDVEAASWFLQGPILGITGTNGKTTTTALTGTPARGGRHPCQVGGNIGRPVAAMVETSRPDQWNVLELSSFQLETTRTLRVRIAAVLNITQNHLDRHHTFERYAAAKARILACQQPEDFAVLNADNPASAALARQARGQVRWFSAGGPHRPGFWLAGGQLCADGGPFPARRGDSAARAAQCGKRCSPPPAARIWLVRRSKRSAAACAASRGSSIASNSCANSAAWPSTTTRRPPASTPRARRSNRSTRPSWVILGGKDKGSDYRELRPLLAGRARAVLLIGSAAPIIASHLQGAVRLIPCGDLRTAVETAWREARPGDTVLLAPACASFDQFSSYEERGRVFKSIVHSLEPRP